MVLSFLYLMARRLVGMLLGSLRSEHANDVEVAVLRHRLSVLRRQVKRPEFRPADRALLAVLRSALARRRWSILLVTPATILGGTAGWSPASDPARPQGGRPPLADHLVALILRLAREHPRWLPAHPRRAEQARDPCRTLAGLQPASDVWIVLAA